ncbi:MAG: extracellular solute-binding protein [Lachnospiraceae bacterium]|nr:extracellular solute-binding protein [Lachnospiraceae bacterium]
MKKVKKVFIAMLMSAAIMIFSGCEKNDDVQEGYMPHVEKEDTSGMVYAGTNLVIDGMEGNPVACVVSDNKLYIQTCKEIGDSGLAEETAGDEQAEEQPDEIIEGTENSGKNLFGFYTAGLDGSGLQELSANIAENGYVDTFLVENDGSIVYLIAKGEKEGFQNELVRIGADGNELSRENIAVSLNLREGDYVSHMLGDKEGNIIIVCNEKIHILDEGLQSVGEVVVEDGYRVIDMALTKDGKVICVEDEYMSSDLSIRIHILDIAGNKWGEIIELDSDSLRGTDYIMNGAEYDFYYQDDAGIYGYDLENGKGTKLMDYAASYMISEDANGIIPIAGGSFIGVTYDNEQDEKSVLMVYEKADSSIYMDRKPITVGTFIPSNKVKKAAMEFNRKNKEYRIEFVEYGDSEDPFTRMLADVTSENAPDIIDLSNFPLSEEQCAQKGLLEDLIPYLEEDSELSSDDFVDSVFEAMKIDGQLYYVTQGFSIDTLAGRTKDVGDAAGWTFDEFKSLLEKKGESVSLFYTENSKEELLGQLLNNGLTDFVDWKTGQCSFDSQDFKDILEICKDRGGDDEQEMTDADIQEMVVGGPARIREGKVLFKQCDSLTPEQVQIDKQIFGEDITYIGYPNREKQGSYFNFDSPMGICSKSQVKEEAWAFIRMFMTREYQGKEIADSDHYSMPTRQDCFDLKLKEKMATEAYTNEFGKEVRPLEGTWNWGSVEFEKKPLSQEEVDIYVNLINNTKRSNSLDEEMMSIVLEEAQAYFKGRKRLNKTVDIIQSRISTYVNEQR